MSAAEGYKHSKLILVIGIIVAIIAVSIVIYVFTEQKNYNYYNGLNNDPLSEVISQTVSSSLA